MEPSVLKEQENEVKPAGGRRTLSPLWGYLGKKWMWGRGEVSAGDKADTAGSHAACMLPLQAGVSLCGGHHILFAARTNEKQGTNERKKNDLPKETSAFIISPMSRVCFLLFFFFTPQGTDTCESSAELSELTLHVFCHLGFQK